MYNPKYNELDVVVLTSHIADEPAIAPGSVGTIVDYNPAFPDTYYVEFSRRNGVPYAFAWLKEHQLLPLIHEPVSGPAH